MPTPCNFARKYYYCLPDLQAFADIERPPPEV
jgi:hypothetical protein